MNPRTTWWLAAVAVALFCYIYFVDLRGRISAERPPAQVFPGLDAAQVKSIDIVRSNQTIRAELTTHDQWQLATPIYPAQSTAIENFLQTLMTLSRQNHIPAEEIISQPGGLAPFGLDPPLATVTLTTETNAIQFRVGAKTLVGDRVYVQQAPGAGVFTTDASLLQHLPATTTQWRNPALIHQANLAFDRISIVAGSRPLQLERDGVTQLWRLVKPLPIRADSGRVEALIQELRNARVSRFVTDDPKQDLEPYGLAQPESELVLTSGTNMVVQVQFGKSPTNDPTQVYARCMAHTNIVLVPREIADLVATPHTVFRDETLLSFQMSAVARIEARADEAFTLQRQPDGDWQIVEPFQAPADRQLLKRFLDDLGRIQIVRFEKDVVADFNPYGLGKPLRQYILKTSVTNAAGITNQTLVQVDFGASPAEEPDKIFCRRSDETSVYVVPIADMFRLEGAAFALRDRRIWSFASSNVVSVTIAQRGQTRELVRDPTTRKWHNDNPVRHAAIEETLYRLGELQADSWTDRGEQRAKLFGAAESKYQLTIHLREAGQPRRLHVAFGNLASGGQPYAAVVMDQGQPVIFKFPVPLYALLVEYLSVPSGSFEL